MNRLALGTARFGGEYGIGGHPGDLAESEVKSILETAWSAGVHLLDTALLYGASQSSLGKIGVDGWTVVSKIPPLPDGIADIRSWIVDSLERTLREMRVNSIYGLLLHRSADLAGARGDVVYETLAELKQLGLIARVGVSIYDPTELDAVIPRFPIDLVQAPLNVLDRRLVTSGWLEKLHTAGIEVHARSLFLQGLLLMDDGSRPVKFQRWQPLWDDWSEWLVDESLTPLQACLSFALQFQEVRCVVVGVESAEQLIEIVQCARLSKPRLSPPVDCDDVSLIDPREWSKV